LNVSGGGPTALRSLILPFPLTSPSYFRKAAVIGGHKGRGNRAIDFGNDTDGDDDGHGGMGCRRSGIREPSSRPDGGALHHGHGE